MFSLTITFCYRVEVKDALKVFVDDLTIFTPGPPAGGPVLALILNILDGKISMLQLWLTRLHKRGMHSLHPAKIFDAPAKYLKKSYSVNQGGELGRFLYRVQVRVRVQLVLRVQVQVGHLYFCEFKFKFESCQNLSSSFEFRK